jgi:hypothetical protein
MKTITIDEARYNQLLPQNVKDTPSDVMSDKAKKTLAVLMNYQLVNARAKESCFVAISNKTLAQSVGGRETEVMKAVQELIELDLVQKTVGKSRTEGEKAMASEYRINFQNLLRPIQKKSFEELFSAFFKSQETSMGAANTNTYTDTNAKAEANTKAEALANINTNTYTHSNIDTSELPF